MDSLLQTWDFYKNKPIELLEQLSDQDLSYKPFETSKTLGWLLNHVADVREVYVRAFEQGGGVTWEDKLNVKENERSIEKLKRYYLSIECRLDQIKNTLSPELVIDWSEMGNPTVVLCMQYMTEHEIFHHGKYSIYLDGLGIDYNITP
ncbi:MAG: DinB family protein [Bacilli bacterium]